MDSGYVLDERSLRELLHALLASSVDPVMLSRPTGEILHANPAACRALGRSVEEIRRLGRQGIVERTPGLERLLAERAERKNVRGEVTFLRPDGSRVPAELSSTLVQIAGGDAVSIIVFRDVTERRMLERELRESEERFRVAFHTLPDAVTITDRDTGTFVSVNAGAAVVTGWEPEEMIGRTAESIGLWADDDRRDYLRFLQEEGTLRDFPTHLGRKDGTVIDVLLSARPIEVGGRGLLLTVTRDVSRQKDAERQRDRIGEQLRQSQKLEAVGRLAGGVAHDFNNLLTVILSCGESLRRRLGEGDRDAREDLAEIDAAAERARDLTRQLLAFARQQVTAPVPLDLNQVVSRSERLLRRILGEDVAFRVDAEREPWTVSADPSQVEQVILNLAVNARDALPAGGRLVVETRNVELDAGGAAAFPGASPGRWVRLAVRDGGTGMPPEVLERIFEPFFTTKPVGKGTGLGLATVHGIVRQGGGHIRVESAPGRGTSVEILFPCVPGPAAALPVAHPRTTPRGHETILLVEDDAQVRDVVSRALREGGYRVLVGRNAEEALSIVLAGEPVQLVVTDVVMPGMNGRELVESIRRHRPGIQALFVSGYSKGAIAGDEVLDPGLHLLQKPFAAPQLLERVRELLDRRP